MRLKIIALLLIVGGAAQAMPPVTNSYEVRRWAIYPAMQQPTFYALQVDGHEYLVMWQYDERSFTHSGSCTNHAPTVVTVTNECTRQHCTNACIQCGTWRPRVSDQPVIRDNMYRGPIPNDWVMGTNGYMVPPNSPEAWPTNRNIIGHGLGNAMPTNDAGGVEK